MELQDQRVQSEVCRFLIHVSSDDPLNCGDTSCLTRCHRGFVSNSCHFFGTPLAIRGRHTQSLRDADNPFRRFRHVTAIPEVAPA
jgi:hypothetical protein